jgi:tetratricopeptide (TPR) repeat protein
LIIDSRDHSGAFGAFDRALDESHQAIAIARETDAKSAMAGGHFNHAVVYALTGQVDEAWEAYQQTLMRSQEAGDVVYESLARWGAGLFKNWEGDYTEATRLHLQAIQIARAHHLLHPLLSGLWSYGLILTGRGAYDDALEAFEEALALSPPILTKRG